MSEDRLQFSCTCAVSHDIFGSAARLKQSEQEKAIADWFSGRRQPTAEQILTVQEFLRIEAK